MCYLKAYHAYLHNVMIMIVIMTLQLMSCKD